MNIISRVYCRIYQKAFKLTLPILPYRVPELIGDMEGLAKLLNTKNIKRVLIVTDKGITKIGLTDELKEQLTKHNIEYSYYDDTVSNPTIQNVEEAKQMYLDTKCEAVVAFGGGSAMDCAKICAARIAKPNQPVSKMEGLLKILKKTPLLIAVPTTAGTGSETTIAAVITDEKTHHKYPINDFNLIPYYAVLDYRVTVGLPKHITSTTGMDALTHAVEAYIGGMTTKFTREKSENAVVLIHKYLKRAYDDGTDVEARKNMLQASYDAGLAFTRSCVGYCHGIAHSLGGKYGVPHGLANAILLPILLEEFGETCARQLAHLARLCEIATTSDSDSVAAKKFIAWIKEMNEYMNIPSTFDMIKREDVPEMAKHAAKESNPLYPVPKLMDANELAEVYYRAGNI